MKYKEKIINFIISSAKKTGKAGKNIFFLSAEKYAGRLISGIMIIIMGFLFAESVLHTMELRSSEEAYEGIYYHHDNFIINIILLALIICVLTIVIPRLEKIPTGVQMGILAASTMIVGVFWVMTAQNVPKHDSYMVTYAAGQAAENNYEFMSERYFSDSPYQLGYVFFCEILIRLFGDGQEKLLYLGVINVIFLTLAYMGILIILKRLFASKRIQTIAVVMMLFCAQPILFSSFLYGIIPGISFAIYALLCEILYFQSASKKRWLWAALSAISITVSVLIKLNNYIVLIAMMILAIVKLLSRRKLKDLIYILMALVLALNVHSAVYKMYEERSGVELDDAVPMLSYMVLGLDYPYNTVGCTAAGWYSGVHTVYNHEENGYDAEKSKAASKKQLMERLSYFANNFREANDFFYEKALSQWNEPTYASIWLNILGKYETPGKIPDYICNEGADAMTAYMNVYQMLVFLGAFCGVAVCMKKKDILCCALILIVMGGFLYHMLFEAKSQYILPYFILLTGFSAVGINWLINKKEQLCKNRKKLKMNYKTTNIC